MMPYIPVPSYRDNDYLRKSRRFRAAADRAVALKREIDEAKVEYDEVRMQKLLPELLAADAERVVFEAGEQRYQIGIVKKKAGKRLNQQRLIVLMQARGYDVSVLDEAMEATEESMHVEIRTVREKDGAE